MNFMNGSFLDIPLAVSFLCNRSLDYVSRTYTLLLSMRNIGVYHEWHLLKAQALM